MRIDWGRYLVYGFVRELNYYFKDEIKAINYVEAKD